MRLSVSGRRDMIQKHRLAQRCSAGRERRCKKTVRSRIYFHWLSLNNIQLVKGTLWFEGEGVEDARV